MARFRCPTSTVDDFNHSKGSVPQRLANMTIRREEQGPQTAGPSKPPNRRDKGKGKGKTQQANIQKRERVRMAMKKEKVKITVNVRRRDWSYVYVGNLNGTITEDMLRQIFRCCGKISCVTIRVSAGSAVAQDPSKAPGRADRLYATVEFSDAVAARRALKHNGRTVFGIQLVVTMSVADLPETLAIVKQYMAKKTDPPKMLDLHAAYGALKRVTVDRTQYIPPAEEVDLDDIERQGPHPPRALARSKALGVSFAQTVL